jgi:hypothetical protein
MHNIDVALIVVMPSTSRRGEASVVLVEALNGKFALPITTMTQTQNTLQCASLLLKTTLGLEAKVFGAGWVDLKPCPLVDSVDRVADGERWICVPYVATIPEEMGVIGPFCKKVPVMDLPTKTLFFDHKEILIAALNHI